MDVLLAIHSVLRWVVLGVLLVGGAYALLRAPTGRPFDDRPFVGAAVVVDLQVLVGLALYLLGSAWEDGTFIAVVHPLVMLAVLAVVHVAVAGARGEDTPRRAHRRVGSAFLFALLLVALAVPWVR